MRGENVGPTSPFLPSVPTLRPQEVRRAGDQAAAPDALRQLAWEVHASFLAVVEQLLRLLQQQAAAAAAAAGAVTLTEKGVLQLLLDVRFARDVLVGGAPASGGEAAAVAQRKRQAAALEQQLQVGAGGQEVGGRQVAAAPPGLPHHRF